MKLVLAPLRAATLALLALVLLASAPAFASTVVDGGSIFGAWRPYLTEIVAALGAAVIGWIVKLARDKFNLDIEARHREALQTALGNAAGLAINALSGVAANARVDVRNAALAQAVNYVLKGAPDALRYFGITPERIREMVMARAAVIEAQAPV